MGLIVRSLSRTGSFIGKRITSPRSNPTAVTVMRSQRYVGKVTPQIYRDWSWHSEYLRAGMDFLLGQLMIADWDLVPAHPQGPKPDIGLVERMREGLLNPNPGKSWSQWVRAAGEDLLTLDAFTVEKERMLNGEIAYLWEADDRDPDPQQPAHVRHDPQPDE